MKLTINLASRRYLNQRSLTVGFFVLIFLLVVILCLQGRNYLDARQLEREYQGHLEHLQEQLLGKLPQQMSPADLAEHRAALLKAQEILERDAFRWTRIFDRMERLLPKGVSLRSFNPDYERKTLSLTGVARDLATLQALLDNLHADAFERAYLLSQAETRLKDSRGMEHTAISFVVNLTGVF